VAAKENVSARNTGAPAAQQISAMKPWFDEFLQNAAFPAVVLAFACAPMNNHAPPSGQPKSPAVAHVPLAKYPPVKYPPR
jgi:hypothetical protein